MGLAKPIIIAVIFGSNVHSETMEFIFLPYALKDMHACSKNENIRTEEFDSVGFVYTL